MEHPLIQKLTTIAELPIADLQLLEDVKGDVRSFAARRDIIRNGEKPDFVHLMLEGWACRYEVVREGKRQITALLLPGDLCDAHVTIFDEMDHSIGALTPVKVAFISRALMMELTNRPAIARALWWASLVDEAILRAWLTNLGQRNAYTRIAHLICEMYARLCNVELAVDDCFDMPLTQEDMGDALGLTSVHVNRSLKRLANDDIVTFRHGKVVILDRNRLHRAADFDPRYLHLKRSVQGGLYGDR